MNFSLTLGAIFHGIHVIRNIYPCLSSPWQVFIITFYTQINIIRQQSGEVLSGLKTEQIKEVCYITIQITPEAILQLAY